MGRKPFSVTRCDHTLVRPAAYVAAGDGLYYLSNLDVNVPGYATFVYRYNPPVAVNEEPDNVNAAATDGSVASKLKVALEKVLTDYYPLAGRLKKGPDGRLAVDCTACSEHGGVLFVEAKADVDVEDIGDLTEPDPEILGKLVRTAGTIGLPDDEILSTLPLLAIQVTMFRCGGFVLGFSAIHMLIDGIATMEFMNSWAETARGLPISTPPFLDRTILRPRKPPIVEFSHPEHDRPSPGGPGHGRGPANLTRSFTFSAEQLSGLKRNVSACAAEKGDPFTSFEALAGLIWRSWAVAHGLGSQGSPEEDVKLMFLVSTRQRLSPPLPAGFMGNAILMTFATCRATELVQRPLSFAAGLLRAAVGKITDAYIRSSIDHLETRLSERKRPPFSVVPTLFISAWSKFEFHRHDFGWGVPAHVGLPLVFSDTAIFFPSSLNPCGETNGVRVMVGLTEPAMLSFQEQITEENLC